MLAFDDIVGADDFAVVPHNYGGLDGSAAGRSVFTFEREPFISHSGADYSLTGYDSASIIKFRMPTVFEGAWFARFTDGTVRFDLYLLNQLVAKSSTLTLSDSPA